jgi:hypothetical protein
MADIVNLKRRYVARRRQRIGKRKGSAAANRRKHGVCAKETRDLAKAREEKAKHDIDAHRLTDDE